MLSDVGLFSGSLTANVLMFLHGGSLTISARDARLPRTSLLVNAHRLTFRIFNTHDCYLFKIFSPVVHVKDITIIYVD